MNNETIREETKNKYLAIAAESSLIRKTKTELVSIILRKDEVEAEHSRQIKALKQELSTTKEFNTGTLNMPNDLIKHLEDINCELTCQNANYQHKINLYRVIIVVLLISYILLLSIFGVQYF